ncbi:MAG: MBL fold metallo-hydrolase [Phycisphaeraceae bacterium]
MIPEPPKPVTRTPGFVYVPPWHVQGVSVAGESTTVQVPELGVSFDLGECLPATLASPVVALSHGHIDHVAGLASYVMQRGRQGRGGSTIVCHKGIVDVIRDVMAAWTRLEGSEPTFKLVGLEHEATLRLDNNHVLRAFETQHTVPSLGYVVAERRKRLKRQYRNLPHDRLEELQNEGVAITERRDRPLVCYMGDTDWGPHFQRSDVQAARVLVTECSFLKAAHRGYARQGKHLHLDHIVSLLELVRAEAVVLTHLPRKLDIDQARRLVDYAVPARHRDRVFLLMDHERNLARYRALCAQGEGV